MNESDYKTALVKQAKAEGYYARRYEDKYQVGIPDMMLKKRGQGSIYIEAKIVEGRYYEPTPRQLIDLLMLNDPPFAFGIVLGIEPRPMSSLATERVRFYFSAPTSRVWIEDAKMLKSFNFLDGLAAYIGRIKNARS